MTSSVVRDGEPRAEPGLPAAGVQPGQVGVDDRARERLPGQPVLGHHQRVVVGALDREPLLLPLEPGQPLGRRDRAVPARLRGAALAQPGRLGGERPAVVLPPPLRVRGLRQRAPAGRRARHMSVPGRGELASAARASIAACARARAGPSPASGRVPDRLQIRPSSTSLSKVGSVTGPAGGQRTGSSAAGRPAGPVRPSGGSIQPSRAARLASSRSTGRSPSGRPARPSSAAAGPIRGTSARSA